MKSKDFLYSNKLKLIFSIVFFKKSSNDMLTFQKKEKIKKSIDYLLN